VEPNAQGKETVVFEQRVDVRGYTSASSAAPLLPLSPPPLFYLVFRRTLCRPRGAQRCCGDWFLGPVYSSLAFLPLLVSARLSHIGVRPYEMTAIPEVHPQSGRSCSLPCFLSLLWYPFFLLSFLALPPYCALVCIIILFPLF
jgi:hypothetical protein